MKKETMTPIERWLAVLQRKIPDRVPMDFWSTTEVVDRLMRHLNCSSKYEMLKKLHVDFVVTVSPAYVGPPVRKDYDVFGIKYQNISFGSGIYSEPVTNPLKDFSTIEEIESNYIWPDPDWWDYGKLHEQMRGLENYPVAGGGSEPFLIYKNLRGQELAFLDLVERPELVRYCLEKLFHLAYQNTLRIFESIPGCVTYTYVAEDMGGQKRLMISPNHIREFLLPGMKKMIDLAHQAGVYVFHHNDGNIIQIIPTMVDAGIDILNPIQWRSDGMDRTFLKENFGDRLIFHGAVDNQYTLPFGSKNEVRQEVIDNIEILGKNGGYIMAPCHNIQPITPLENIIEMYSTGYEEGWY